MYTFMRAILAREKYVRQQIVIFQKNPKLTPKTQNFTLTTHTIDSKLITQNGHNTNCEQYETFRSGTTRFARAN